GPQAFTTPTDLVRQSVHPNRATTCDDPFPDPEHFRVHRRPRLVATHAQHVPQCEAFLPGRSGTQSLTDTRGLTTPPIVQSHHSTVQIGRTNTQDRTGHHRGQTHLYALDVLPPDTNRSPDPEPEPCDKTSPLSSSVRMLHNGPAGTELQSQHHCRVWDQPKCCQVTYTEAGHVRAGHPIDPLRTHDVPLGWIVTFMCDGPHDRHATWNRSEHLFKPSRHPSGDSESMTTPDQRSHLKDHTRPTEASFLSLEDGDMYVCQDGPQDASTLLLIHGSASSSRSWNPLVPLLAPSHHIIRLDLPGHGRSDEPADRDYKISRQAHRVGSALDRLGVERTIVVGHSSGGVVATALAEQRPELVTALVLINTGPSMEAFLLPESAVTGPSSWPPSDEQIRRFAKTGFGGKDQQVPQELVDDVRGMSHHAFITTMQ